MLRVNKGSAAEMCAEAKKVSAAYLSERNKDQFAAWKAKERQQCKAMQQVAHAQSPAATPEQAAREGRALTKAPEHANARQTTAGATGSYQQQSGIWEFSGGDEPIFGIEDANAMHFLDYFQCTDKGLFASFTSVSAKRDSGTAVWLANGQSFRSAMTRVAGPEGDAVEMRISPNLRSAIAASKINEVTVEGQTLKLSSNGFQQGFKKLVASCAR